MIFGSSAAEVLKHGLAPGLEPPDPVEADPVTIPEAQREQRGIRRLPATRHEALDVSRRDAILTDALGSDGLVRRMGMHCGVAVPHTLAGAARVAGFGRGGTGHRRDQHGAAAHERRVGR
jgi:hypothetical protein